MIKRIAVILIAVMFAGSMALMPVVDAANGADSKAAVTKCGCGKDCKCEHCTTGKGECACKGDSKGGCSCGKGCSCEHCKSGKGGCNCKSGSKGCNCKSDGKGCHCGKDCKCEHCKTGKGECTCKGDGKGGCSCGKGCNCGHCNAGAKTKAGAKGCNCKSDGKGCHCGKDCKCEHCKTGKGECACKGDGKGGCSCGKGCNCAHCAGGADDVKAPSAESDYAKTMTSKAGAFKATYSSEADSIAVNKMMIWKLKIDTADGKPVKDADIKVAGAMPEHGHGFPTDPKVTKNNGDGTYQVEGIKFSMTGWWTVTFTIKSGGKTDSVTFNLRLK